MFTRQRAGDAVGARHVDDRRHRDEHRHRRAESGDHQQREHLARDRGQGVQRAAERRVDPAPLTAGQQREQARPPLASSVATRRRRRCRAPSITAPACRGRDSRCRASARRSWARTRRRPRRCRASSAPDCGERVTSEAEPARRRCPGVRRGDASACALAARCGWKTCSARSLLQGCRRRGLATMPHMSASITRIR